MKTLASLLLALAPACPSPAAAALTRIGAAGGISGKVVALAPEAGAAGRVMGSGQTLFHQDKVSTDAKGRMQVLLLDQTTFTIGPDTELVLDEFVYDPFNDSGKVGVRVTKGVFRFVTGKIARKEPENVKIKLPVGTLGIRGTIGAGATDGNTAIAALIGPGPGNDADEKPGAITLSNAGVTQTITRQGYYSEIPGPDQPPTPPKLMTPEVAARVDPKPAAESGGGEEPGGATSAAQASGEQTAQAQGDLQSTQSTGLLAASFDNTTSAAGQDAVEANADGPATWDQVRGTTLSGVGMYSMSGSYACEGELCGISGSGGWTGSVDVDFASRVICGVSISLSGSRSGTATSLEGPFIPFGSGGGTAEHAFTAANLTNDGFAGSRFTFLNKDGVAGGAGKMEIAFTDLSDTVTSATPGQGNFQK